MKYNKVYSTSGLRMFYKILKKLLFWWDLIFIVVPYLVVLLV